MTLPSSGESAHPARRFWSSRHSARLVLILVAIGLALVLALGFAMLALKPTSQSACVSGDFAAVRTAIAAAPAYDYRTTGTVHLFRGSPSDTQGPVTLGLSGQYRAPGRLALTFDDPRSSVSQLGMDGDPVQTIRWITPQTGYALFDIQGQPQPVLWNAVTEPLRQDTTVPDFVTYKSPDPLSFQLAGSTTLPTPLAWARWSAAPAVTGASCAFEAVNSPSATSTQTVRVWVGARDLPVQTQEIRVGFRSLYGESRDQDLITAVTYPVNPAPVEPPALADIVPTPSLAGSLPPGWTPPVIFPPAEHVITAGQTATLPDRLVTAVEVRETMAADDGHAAPPGLVFMSLHLHVHMLAAARVSITADYFVAQRGHYFEDFGRFTNFFGGLPGFPFSRAATAGADFDGWITTLVPATGDVRYEMQADPDHLAYSPPYNVPNVEIVLRP